MVVDQGLDLPPRRPGHDRIPDPQGAPLDDDRGHRAAADLELGLEDHAPGPTLGAGHQLLHFGHQDDLLQQVLDAQALERRDLHGDGVTAPRLGDQAVLGELLEHPVGVGLLAVDLVDGHHDGHVGRLGVVDGLDGLGHHAVVGRHHQHHDVGDVGAPGPHGGERLVARGVDEGDRVAVPVDLVGPDVLGDAAGLAGHHVGRPDAVEQQRLAVVDVAHHGDHRRAGPEIGLILFLVVVIEELGQQLGLPLLPRVDQADVGAELRREQLDHVVAQRLGGGDHLALQQEEPDHVPGRAVELGARSRAVEPRSMMTSVSGTGAVDGV